MSLWKSSGPRPSDAEGTGAYRGFADLFDGVRARVQRVALTIDEGAPAALILSLPDGETRRWPLDGLRRLRDQADGSDLVLTSLDQRMARLIIRDADAIRLLARRCPLMGRTVPVAGKARILGWAAAAVGSVLAIVFLLVPLMADQLAPLIPPKGEKALGDTTFRQIRRALADEAGEGVALCNRPQGRRALDIMVDRFTPHMQLPYPLTVHVLDHPMVNAFALPGGHMVLFRGLIEAAGTPEELAAVFAHEVGHVSSRDPTRAALRTAGSVGVLGLLMGDFAGGTLVLVLTERLIEARYSQAAELAADSQAHALLSAAELPAGALGAMFERMRDAPPPLPTPRGHDDGDSYEDGEPRHSDDEEGSDAAGDQPRPMWGNGGGPDRGTDETDDGSVDSGGAGSKPDTGILGHFASHPALSARIAAARAADRAAGVATTPLMRDADWRALRRICR